MIDRGLQLESLLKDIVGDGHVRAAVDADAIDGVAPKRVAVPGSDDEAARILALAYEQGLSVVPRGAGSQLGWGNAPRAIDLVLSTERLDHLVEHAHGDMTATVQAGMSLDALQRKLAENGQTLMLDVPHSDRATIGGLIATNASGSLRGRYGGVRDQILGVTFVRADGVIAHGGGRVVKNVAGYDLPKLLTGSLGTLGLITQATFRLYPVPREMRSLRVTVSSPADATALLLEIQASTLMPTGLLYHTKDTSAGEVLVRFAGIEESVDAQVVTATELIERRGHQVIVVGGAVSGQLWGDLANEPWIDGGIVLKVSVLPTDIGFATEALHGAGGASGWTTQTQIHGHGLGVARIDQTSSSPTTDVVSALGLLGEMLRQRGGSVVVLQAPPEVKSMIDAWGPASDAIPLMRRVKAEMDPRSVLNPGRFIGGI